MWVVVGDPGTTACFLLDGATYVVAASCYAMVQWQVSPAALQQRDLEKLRSLEAAPPAILAPKHRCATRSLSGPVLPLCTYDREGLGFRI